METKDEFAPAISVIIPVYNAAPFLDKCISSVLCQTFSSFELILINDGSTDESLDICDLACRKDSRVRLISYLGRHGVSYARNRGIDSSAGVYLFFLDADDCIHPQLLGALFQQAEQTRSDMVISERIRSDAKNESYWMKYCTKSYNPAWTFWCKDEVLDNWFKLRGRNATWAKLFRKETIGNIRFNEQLSIAEDTLFNYCFLAGHSCRLSYTKSPGYYYRIRDDSLCHEVSKEKLLTWVQVISGIKDRELSAGRRANAIILEDEKLSLITNWLSDTQEGTEDLTVVLEKERDNPLYNEVSVFRKFKIFLCLNFGTLYRLLRKINRRIFKRYFLE